MTGQQAASWRAAFASFGDAYRVAGIAPPEHLLTPPLNEQMLNQLKGILPPGLIHAWHDSLGLATHYFRRRWRFGPSPDGFVEGPFYLRFHSAETTLTGRWADADPLIERERPAILKIATGIRPTMDLFVGLRDNYDGPVRVFVVYGEALYSDEPPPRTSDGLVQLEAEQVFSSIREVYLGELLRAMSDISHAGSHALLLQTGRDLPKEIALERLGSLLSSLGFTRARFVEDSDIYVAPQCLVHVRKPATAVLGVRVSSHSHRRLHHVVEILRDHLPVTPMPAHLGSYRA